MVKILFGLDFFWTGQCEMIFEFTVESEGEVSGGSEADFCMFRV